jgi:hypothetical protein
MEGVQDKSATIIMNGWSTEYSEFRVPKNLHGVLSDYFG